MVQWYSVRHQQSNKLLVVVHWYTSPVEQWYSVRHHQWYSVIHRQWYSVRRHKWYGVRHHLLRSLGPTAEAVYVREVWHFEPDVRVQEMDEDQCFCHPGEGCGCQRPKVPLLHSQYRMVITYRLRGSRYATARTFIGL